MKCPNCQHVSDAALLKCSACGQAWDRASFETLQHLEYLLAWLDERAEALGQEAHARLRDEALSQLDTVRATLRLAPAVARPVEEIVPELALVEAARKQVERWLAARFITRVSADRLSLYLTDRAENLKTELARRVGRILAPTEIAPPSDLELVDFALESLPLWVEKGLLYRPHVGPLRDHLNNTRTVLLRPPPPPVPALEEVTAPTPSAPEPVPAPAVAPRPAPKVAPLPRPKRPPIDWGKVWEKIVEAAVSGALLRGLLYLGAFMIVISSTILVIRFWAIFPKGVQLAIIAAVPSSFYLAGWGVRSKLRLPQAGGVLTGIGALLVAVDFAAIYQFGGLAVDFALYWLASSAICTVIYAFTAWRLPIEFFGYITLIGVNSALMALIRVLGLSLEWQIASLTALAMAMVESAARLERAPDRWAELARATRRLPQVLLPVSLAIVLFESGTAAPRNPTLGHMGTFAFAALSYGLLAWRFPAAIFAHATVWSSIGAAGFALWAAGLPLEWYATAGAALSPLYILAGQWVDQRLSEDFAPRRAYLTAVNLGGSALVALALLAGFVMSVEYPWPSVIALSLCALVLAGYAYLFRRPILVLVAGGLFLAPYSLAIYQWLGDFNVAQSVAWLVAAWAGLALAYLALAALLRTAEKYGAWLNLVAHGLAPLASLGLLFNYIETADSWFAAPTITALGGVILIYLASAAIHDSGRHPALSDYVDRVVSDKFRQGIFLWPVGFLLPIWLAVAWLGSALDRPWLGAALAGLALAYVVLGQLLAGRKVEYRLPPHVYAYALAVVAILTAFGQAWPLLISLYIVVGVLGALAFVYRRVWETALATLLFIWPFQLSLEVSPLALHAYSLAYALLASLGYIPLGIALDKAGRKYTLPAYIVGYALSAYAVVASLLGRFGVYPLDVPWVGVAVPLIVAGLQVFSLYRFRQFSFAWAATVVFPIAFGQTLGLLRLRPEYYAAAWVGLAFAYVLTERALARHTLAGRAMWWRALRRPLGAGATALCVLGLLLTVYGTTVAFTGGQVENHFPLILAQTLAVGLTVLATRLYRSRWPLYLEPWLAFFPVTLFFIGYGMRLFGQALITPQYGIVWLATGLAHLLAGVVLDRNKVRYAQGLYLGGYALAGLALLWSAPERLSNLYTLTGVIVLALASHALVHYGRHRSFDDFIRFIWRKPDTIAQRAARTGFLFFTAYAFPVWLAQLMAHYEVALAWRGLALALVAPFYIAFGLAVRRLKTEYTWPLYSAGYALTAVGAMVTFQDEALAIYVLALNALVYAASAYIFRQTFWLYLSNILVPVVGLLTLHYNFQALPAPWVAGIFMALAFLYVAAGQWFDRRRREATASPGVVSFALPFYTLGYLLSAVALAVASGEKFLALTVYSAGVVLYGLSAWVFRESVFLYPAAWLAAVPYYLVMTLTPLPPLWYGLGWLPLVTGYVALGRLVFQKAPLGVKNLQTFFAALTHPAMPFYLLAYVLSAGMIAVSQGDPLILILALVAGAAVYFASAALFRRPAWLYPALAAGHLALMKYLTIRPPGGPGYYTNLPFLGMTWATALVGYWASWRFRVAQQTETGKLGSSGPSANRQLRRWELDLRSLPFVGYLVTPSWAQPFFLFAAFDLLFWQALALRSFEMAMFLATGHAVLLAVFAMLWQDATLAYGTLAYSLLAVGYRLRWAELPFADALAWVGGIGFGLYLVGRFVEQTVARVGAKLRALAVWSRPLTNAAMFVTTVAVIATLPTVATRTTATAAGLAFAGALYLAIAYRGRYYRLGYLGMAMLILAWALALVVRDVRQPQLYAIPAGLYLTGMGFLERQRVRRPFAIIVEGFGLSVLLLTSFTQSLGGAEGFPYFLLLLVEALLVIWWGAARRIKVPFFIGLGASVLNVVAQVVVLVNVHQVNRWFVFLSVGLLLVTAAVFVERQRERIIARSQEWRETLETWE